MRVLSDAGLVEVHAIANRRLCRLRPEPFQELDAWLAPYRQLWQERYDKLDDYLERLQRRPNAADPPAAPAEPDEASDRAPQEETP